MDHASPSLVKLNIGGTRFMTTASTLTSRGDNFFTALLRGGAPLLRDEDGCIFIDRDGAYFAPLLSFLRTGELEIPPTMSRRLLEREALFYLIDLSAASRAVVNPLSMTATSLGAAGHVDLRFDGLYVQRHPHSGAFVGYYIFFGSLEEVRYKSISNLNANEIVYARPSRYTRLAHPWLVMHWGNNAHPSKMVASIQPHGLTVEWRYPPRPEHCKPLPLTFYPSVEPLIGVLFSDEVQQRATTPVCFRVYFADRTRVQLSLIDRASKRPIRRNAEYSVETINGLCFVHIASPIVNLSLLSVGGLLFEHSVEPKRAASHLTFASRSVRVLVAVGTEPDAEDVGANEIDIYEFLRTYHPDPEQATVTEDSSEVEDDVQLLDEPYIVARALSTRAAPAATVRLTNDDP